MQFKSKEELKRTLASSDTVAIENLTIPLLLDNAGINAVLYNDAFAKVCFTCSVVSEFLRERRVVYIDLDTVFTSYVRNNVFIAERGDLEIFLPAQGELEPMLSDICSHLDAATGIVVVDSLNSFYHLYDGIRVGPLNRLLSTYVSLLLNHTRRIGCTLVVTSMIRHKKLLEWKMAPSSKRLIEAKSSVILEVGLGQDGLLVNVVKHRPLKLQSKKLFIAKSQIPIRS